MLERPFLDKFMTTPLFSKKADLVQSIKNEIINIIYSRLKHKNSPFNFGVRDIVEIDLIIGWKEHFSNHICQQLMLLEPRIGECTVTQIHSLQDAIQIVIKIKLKCEESHFFVNVLY